jgi:hypothetical protein
MKAKCQEKNYTESIESTESTVKRREGKREEAKKRREEKRRR